MVMLLELGRGRFGVLACLAGLCGVGVGGVGSMGCSSSAVQSATPSKPVAPSPPPRDDGKPAQGGDGGDLHSAALEQLRIAPMGPKTDKQNSIVVPLPDAPNWTRVRFLTVPGLVGFRYGKSHHAIVAGFVTHVDDNTVEGACSKSFESWAMPWVEAFEVDLHHDPPAAFPWTLPAAPVVAAPLPAPDSSPPVVAPATIAPGSMLGRMRLGRPQAPPAPPAVPKKIAIVDVDPLYAKTATILSRESYAAAWAAYPAWDKACLIVGVAVPARDDEARAREVRDRFVKEVLPHVVVTTPVEPKERY
ncbi:MAG: hypothetical protein JWO86_2312 [Myxococcaceae bacterium]|nr:hypothetical protein [Myxococcaceae bacterium]